MSVEQQVRSLLSNGDQKGAVLLAEEAAIKNDTWACFCLAEWKIAGQGMPRDIDAAFELYRRAASLGHLPSNLRLARLYATGTGTKNSFERAHEIVSSFAPQDKFSAAEIALLSGELEADLSPDVIRATGPNITKFSGFLSIAECEWIRSLAAGLVQPSFVEDPQTGERIPHPIRTSHGMSFGPLQENLPVNRINRRIAKWSETDYSWGEPLHVLRYLPGQQYRPHFDALPAVTNQRIKTAIVFLNDDFKGGETTFPELDLKLRMKSGDMLLFDNVGSDGRRLDLSKHAGLPVIAGEKWIATRWIREEPYHPWIRD
ncbi:hypothetical protein GCM10023115_04520 [Pontixanthobacter gangjinensis]|uniref:Proline hydroxylase n=1 Tax=Pontixanthobacter gangjinensis TaxID=1028742 RepID=A0A6I4SJ75_9SPHN|nr:2OG-Fe(II) oxygenase [Pontixanthobacter gangjinensis]MXO55705.1 proline hydroxylase [Pontixanthobacter gangjinensis]